MGWWAWERVQSGEGFGFGQIRLGEDYASRGASSLFERDSPLIAIPVTIIAGTIAVTKALPLLAMSFWRSAKGYLPVGGGAQSRGRFGASGAAGQPYASRGAFAARRGEYIGVVEDEDELLGEDEFEENDEEV